MKYLYIEQVDQVIADLTQFLTKSQKTDGRWSFCFESGTMTDAYMILLMKLLGRSDSRFTGSLLQRILGKQTRDGTWKLFQDEKEGNLSATIDSSLALLYAGVRDRRDPLMRKAREFILEQGGTGQAGSLTKVILCLLGHLDWFYLPKIPVEIFLLPSWFPVHFFDFVGYTRVHVAPILLAADREFSVKLPGKSAVSEWLPPVKKPGYPDNRDHIWTKEEIRAAFAHVSLSGKELHTRAVQWGERFMLERIEPDGTLYSYFSSTFLMIVALLALGYKKNHPVIQKAMKGLYSFVWKSGQKAHLQETTSSVWDTSLILYALQEAGMKPDHPVVRRGLRYLLQRQHTRSGDWVIRNPGVLPGGWGFSDVNTMNPDVDDTAACLRALAPSVRQVRHKIPWDRGLSWLLSMQNKDGGWPAFERNTDKAWLKLLPFKDGRPVWGDPSTADLTGRTLEFLGREMRWTINHPIVRRGWNWLYRHQRPDGSWFGRWGISGIYGTWAALTGMAAVRVPRNHPVVRKGIQWLLSIQNRDGGWGESCYSDLRKRYVPLRASTPSQTAWALDALISFHDKPTPAIQSGVKCLLSLLEKESWESSYPTGAGLPGQFYIHYHSYRYIWPLLTLVHYRKKYKSG
ncbi:squalene--hopene cyclase [Paenactinomyces guangxiensis]|uniref:Squalene--hopene cyclase n=1 Tax=Paenactinomyces guangxiensis TaxID=1490290 RepID=A0A7W1WSD5_9BACL|nr:squalene--hopene cyclase [Paenactinomyces guangxiensis]MBA4495205.1 squalene--hopene cyclase [Paenactinomyces guangxiensis]MBH8592289.1 squalene--hopene cyclase [Paenactinomyces guangxiensis]